MPTLTLYLRNHTLSHEVFAYVTGYDESNRLFLLEEDGKTLYFPTSLAKVGSKLAVRCGIALPAPTQTRTVTVPTYFGGGRVYFSINSRLIFKLNPGPGLVEPSVTNNSDPNINVHWDFCELTFNSSQVYANISYVDFFSIPIALTLYTPNGSPQHVTGTFANGLETVIEGLKTQEAKDNAGWTKLIHNGPAGKPLRVLSPNSGTSTNDGLFENYFHNYISEVWSRYAHQPLTIDTQVAFGNVSGRVSGGRLTFSGASFVRPTTHDILSCSTGPFETGDNEEVNAIIPRIAAAFNRSTLLLSANQPNGATASQFYASNPTNHYARVLHDANIDRRGYAFPYDDVTASDGKDQSGSVFGEPKVLIVSVGGHGASKHPALLHSDL